MLDGTKNTHLMDRRSLPGPFDIIGDVHGCADELEELLSVLGYRVDIVGRGDQRRAVVADRAPSAAGRTAVFVGDLVDRGPRAPDTLRIVMAMSAAGQALCVPGNHDTKFRRWLDGRSMRLTHGLERTVAQVQAEPFGFRAATADFIDSLPLYLWLESGQLVVAHAGIEEQMIGRVSSEAQHFCIYGDTDGKVDANGLAIRYNWAARYRGAATIVYGHTPVETATWLNGTACIDTGCCFGGSLTALRWPEREIVAVAARQTYQPRGRAFGLPGERP
jgi:protein phosphatase